MDEKIFEFFYFSNFSVQDKPVEIDIMIQSIERKFPFRCSYSGILEIPHWAFDSKREQYRAEDFFIQLVKVRRFIAFGVTAEDIFIENLNFIFGLASPTASVGIVSTKRLYSDDSELYYSRLRKEVIHETGHILGSDHCFSERCVMNFSNSLADVDRKRDDPCNDCRKIIEENLWIKGIKTKTKTKKR